MASFQRRHARDLLNQAWVLLLYATRRILSYPVLKSQELGAEIRGAGLRHRGMESEHLGPRKKALVLCVCLLIAGWNVCEGL